MVQLEGDLARQPRLSSKMSSRREQRVARGRAHLEAKPPVGCYLSTRCTICLTLLSIIIISISPQLSVASTSTSGGQHVANQTTASSQSSTSQLGKTSPPVPADSKAGTKSTGSTKQQLEQQSTDVSNMYVQIPIAEPADTGVPDGVQQTLSDESGDSTGESGKSWTGPWPKKFQIGYIKQSDLHQVLIESLKSDPFVSLGGQSSPPSKTTPAKAAPVEPQQTNSLQQQQQQQQQSQQPQQPQQQWPAGQAPQPQNLLRAQQPMNSIKNQPIFHATGVMSHGQLSHNLHEAKMLQQPMHMNRFHQQQMANFLGANQARGFAIGGQPMKMLGAAFHNPPNHRAPQHQQVHFEGFPSSMFKNQPMYTINNFPMPHQQDQQQQVLSGGEQMQLIMGTHKMMTGQRPQKSAEYYSSWRPVTSDKSAEPVGALGKNLGQSNIQLQSGMIDYQAPADGFDDGFSAPTTGKDSSGTQMNRHPVLNNYLTSLSQTNEQTGSGKTSPAVKAKMATKSAQGPVSGTKTAQQPASTKTDSTGSAKGGQDMNLSVNRRRTPPSQNGTSTSSPSDTETTTVSSVSASTEADGSPFTTSIANNSSSTTTTESSTTVEATSEPDSEVLENETTEPSVGPTTPISSPGEQPESSSPASERPSSSSSPASSSTTAVSSSTVAPGESEVATQSIASGSSANLPAVPGGAGDESTVSSTADSQREETTPRSTGSTEASASAEAKGEVEGSKQASSTTMNSIDSSPMSDEALQAAAMRGASEIAKTAALSTRAKTQQASSSNSTGGGKKTRSSERLVASSQQLPRRALPQQKAPQPSKPANKKPSGTRTGKQVAPEAASDVKGRLQSNQSNRGPAVKQRKTSSGKSATVKPNNKSSMKRMAQSERLQQQQPTAQIFSMSAAQAQSTAQTLASLLLSRCLSSNNCAHLLDICSTKQAMIQLPGSGGNELGGSNASPAANWSMPAGVLASSSIMSLAQQLQADKALRIWPQWKDAVDNVVDHETSAGYTLLLPSNEAVERLAAGQADSWMANSDLMSQIIENHVLDSAELIEIRGAPSGSSKQSSTNLFKAKGLQVNQHRDKMVTINGKRLVYANQAAPSNGRIHVIDGILDYLPPSALSGPSSSSAGTSSPSSTSTSSSSSSSASRLLDIMDTLKQCDKFDGFVTLAEGTGLTQILKQDGPMTVFVPSNEALRKIPDEELEVIKNNSTALKEFLMYHVVNGSYFSQDLRDGQQLASILDMKPIQVGVRVDGCSRRLVEANTSPMRRPDIVAKNGVIHILDWYLTVRDNDWCDPIGRSVQPVGISSSAERLQQLASEGAPVAAAQTSYATRMSVMPLNHKLFGSEAISSIMASAAKSR